jgi:hypothetical protein
LVRAAQSLLSANDIGPHRTSRIMLRDMARSHRCRQFVAVLLALGLPSVVFAQTGSERAATAEALFKEGKRLMDERMPAQACVKFAASQSLDPALGTLLNLADCHERIGKTASAWAEFLNAKSEALRLGQTERASVAGDRAKALEPRLTRLLIAVPSEARIDGLVVMRDNLALDPGVWDSPMPVDPGAHSASATAPGRVSWSHAIDVQGEGKTLTVTIPKLELETIPTEASAAPSAVLAPVGVPNPAAVASTSASERGSFEPPRNASLQRPAGLLVAGGGLVAVAIGSYFGLSARSKWSDADCANQVCPTAERQQMAEDAKKSAYVSTGLFVGGGVLMAVGAVLYFTAPSANSGHVPPPADRGGLALVPTMDRHAGSLSLRGRF